MMHLFTGERRISIAHGRLTIMLALVMVASVFVMPLAKSESLFAPLQGGLHPRSNAPRMLYSPPRPQQIGDLVTINIEEVSKREGLSTLQLQKQNQIEENTSTVLNNAATDILGRFSGMGRLAELIRLPNLGGINNQNNNRSQAAIVQRSLFEDTITCQVVQVMPNGNLMVQGRKTMAHAKERTDYYVTGIVNPYFLNSQNQISSKQVANMQVLVAGKGIITRSQNDGVASKIMSYVQ